MIQAHRYHDISCGHRVVGHETKCRGLHGHNYRVHFTLGVPQLDAVGRVLDFSAIKSRLCMWLEENWDHKTLLWDQDPVLAPMRGIARTSDEVVAAIDAILPVPFNPTAENMADHLLRVVGPAQLAGTDVKLVSVSVEETRKCGVTAAHDDD